MSKLTDQIFKIKRKMWLSKIRKKIKNKNFTIISNNCTAGFIYHDLGLKFLTPTINLFIRTDEYITFISDLKYYLSSSLIEDKTKKVGYPVGILKSNNKKKPDIHIYFNHYKTFKDAKDKWEERKKRINFDNICYIMDFYDNSYDVKLIDSFNKLKLRNKIVLLHNSNIHKKNSFCFKYVEDEIPNGKLFLFTGLTGKRNMDEFDYVEFINNIKKED